MHGSGLLSATPPDPTGSSKTAPATSYTFDPLNPQPSAYDPRDPAALFPRGGFDLRARPAGCQQQTGADSRTSGSVHGSTDGGTRGSTHAHDPGVQLGNRHDVLVFATEPLKDPVEVSGSASVELYASSTGLDTDFTARLVDWYPPSKDYPEGYALELCQTILRARYRNSRERAELLEPNQVYRFVLPLPPSSNLFARGHRIRVDISSSDFPRFDVNPNTGEPLGQHRRVLTVTNSVYHDPDHPSAVVLPVVPGAAGSEI
jgi:putative CocE/NonD family hydrolase